MGLGATPNPGPQAAGPVAHVEHPDGELEPAAAVRPPAEDRPDRGVGQRQADPAQPPRQLDSQRAIDRARAEVRPAPRR